MSSFWLILKQQWTIKMSSPCFLFLAWRPSWLEFGITGHIFGRGSCKDHSTNVWFKLAQWLQRSWLKCEKLMDERTYDGRTDYRRRMLSGDNNKLSSVKCLCYIWIPCNVDSALFPNRRPLLVMDTWVSCCQPRTD